MDVSDVSSSSFLVGNKYPKDNDIRGILSVFTEQ